MAVCHWAVYGFIKLLLLSIFQAHLTCTLVVDQSSNLDYFTTYTGDYIVEAMMEPIAAAVNLPTTVKPNDTVYEVKAVDKRARSLLEIINEINGQLDAAKTLRRQRDDALSGEEKRLIDNTFESSERALAEVAKLVEPRQIELKSNKGNMGFGTRLMYILRDSPEIMFSLVQLGYESQRLQAALDILSGREDLQNPSWSASPAEINQPPTYEESQFLTRRRVQNVIRKANNIPSPELRSEISSAPRDHEGLTEEGDELGDLIDFTSNNTSPRLQDELFFDAVDTSNPNSSRSTYIAYRPVRASTGPSETTINTMRRTLRAMSDPNLSQSQQLKRNSLPNRVVASSGSVDVSKRPRPVDRNSVPLVMPDSRYFAFTPPATPSITPLSQGHERQVRPPPVKPKPDALRARMSTGTLASDLSAVQTRSRRDWESLPSQLQRPASIPTFVFTCASPEPGGASPRPVFQNMVKLEAGCDQHALPTSIHGNVAPEPSQEIRPLQPSLQSEFPEVVTEESLMPLNTQNRAAQAPTWGPSYGAIETTGVSVEMLTRSRSSREARLLDRASHAPEVMPRSRSIVAPEVVPLSRAVDAPEVVTSPQISTIPSTVEQRRPSAASSLDTDRSSVDTSGGSARQPSLTGRARSQRWRELQYEKSQSLERGQWIP